MSEIANIAALAQRVSDKIFDVFGWQTAQIKDEDFPCDNITEHQTKGSGGKHPLDCVFFYEDPFTDKKVYLLTDLKSYKKSTLESKDYAPYIRSLGKATQCAATSKTWQGRYTDGDPTNFSVDGLLFVYNHDAAYDKEFKIKAKGLAPGSLKQSRSTRIHLIDPNQISNLQSITTDLKSICGEKELQYKKRKIFYPQQPLRMPGDSLMDCANIEILRSRRQIICVPDADGEMLANIYIRTEGSIDSFEYLITFLYRSGLTSLAKNLRVVGYSMCPEAFSHFNSAKIQFLKRHYSMPEIKGSLERISIERLTMVTEPICSDDEATLR